MNSTVHCGQDRFFPSISSRVVIVSGLVACTLLWACTFLFHWAAGKPLLLPYNGRLLLFPYPGPTALWFAASLLIPLAILLLLFFNNRKGRLQRQDHPLLFIFLPLLFLPVPSCILLFRLQVDQQIVANILFYVPVLLFSFTVFNAVAYFTLKGANPGITNGTILLVGIFFVLFYWLTGWYFTLSCGEHAGDEGHYIIQAKSLYQDRDLDLYNNFSVDEQHLIRKGWKEHLHISPTSKKDKFYSWHPFGLPLYLSILPPDNLALRHLLLAVLSGLGSAGLLVLCRYLHVTRQTALLFVFLCSFSSLWGIYSSRVLPELPGAVFAIWTAVALFSVRNHPWSSALILVVSCGYLPFLHQRFVPVSLFGYLFFVFSSLRAKPLKKQWPVLLFATSGLAFLALVYLYVNSQLFTTAVGYTSSQFIPELSGVWKVLLTNSSVTYILPSFAWIMTAAIISMFMLKQHRFYCLFSLFAFVSVLFLACSNSGWSGGSSAMGRYLVVVFPLLVPLSAYLFDRTNRVAKWWFIFLSLISVFYLFLLLLRLPEFKSSFGDPRHYIGFIYDYFKGLLDPFPPAKDASLFPLPAQDGILFPILFFTGTLFLLVQKKWEKSCVLYPAFIIAAAIYFHHPENIVMWEDLDERGVSYLQEQNAITLMESDSERSFILSKKPEQSYSIFEASNLLSGYQNENIASVSTQTDLKGKMDNLVFQPEMLPNDWTGKPYFWTTLGRRFTTRPVQTAFFLTGKLTGDAEAHLLVIELGGKQSHTLFEKKFQTVSGTFALDEKQILHPTGDGIVHVLVRIISGEGTFTAGNIGWSPVNPYLLEKASAFLPEDFSYQLDK